MRKLHLQMQISIDGFVSAGPNDDQKWVTWAWDEIKHYVLDLAGSADTEIIGRKLAVDYIPYWFDALEDPSDPMYEAAKIKATQKKIVFTRTLKESQWENTELAKGNLIEEVNKLKKQSGKSIIVYGGSSFVSSLLREQLVDELHLFINPVALGKGVPVFEKLQKWQALRLKKALNFESGIVLLNYEVS
ncbi:MAG: dihydrofolate reductase [Alphaproteobacteria bacterium]|nr:MAG: dihydrofolate reductase [Alphaproteobacteria bacterium]